MKRLWLLTSCTGIILGCSVYQSNARKNFESKATSYVVPFSDSACIEVFEQSTSPEYQKIIRPNGQIEITQVIPHENQNYRCTETYANEEEWLAHKNQYLPTDFDDETPQPQGSNL